MNSGSLQYWKGEQMQGDLDLKNFFAKDSDEPDAPGADPIGRTGDASVATGQGHQAHHHLRPQGHEQSAALRRPRWWTAPVRLRRISW